MILTYLNQMLKDSLKRDYNIYLRTKLHLFINNFQLQSKIAQSGE
jgi:hypothetical protein